MAICQRVLSGALSFVAVSTAGVAAASAPKLLGTLAAKSPAFVRLVPGNDGSGSELLVSSFGIMGGDALQRLPLGAGTLASLGSVKAATITDKVTWPNEVSPVPSEIFGPDYLTVGTGFLVPGRSTGQVLVVHKYTGEQFALSQPKNGYFYHRIDWVDMNGDGRLDALTARGRKSLLGASDGELVWFEQPQDGRKGPWEEHVIAKGPDVHFATLKLPETGAPIIVAAEFFARRLSIHWQDGETWQHRVIDDALGAAFDVTVEDLNGDGRPDLLVTNHDGRGDGKVYAYEVPAAFATAPWPRHVLAKGIKVASAGMNAAAPGSPLPWHLPTGGKPRIFVAGDGSQKVHLLTPRSADPSDWTYDQSILLDARGTVGTMWIGDVAGQGGERQLFVPAYDADKIYVYDLGL